MEACSCGCRSGLATMKGESQPETLLCIRICISCLCKGNAKRWRETDRLWVTGDTKPLDPAEPEAGGLSQDFSDI